MKPLCVIDLETDPFKFGRDPQPFVAGVYWGDGEFRTFRDLREAWDFCCSRDWYVYAHNGGKFDFKYFVQYIQGGTRVKLINGRLAEFKQGKAIWRDSYCRYPMALATHDKDGDFDYSLMEAENREGAWEDIIKYLRRDCKSAWELMTYGHKTYGSDLTLATSAMQFWQGQSGIKAPKTDAAFYATFAPWYNGGRVECYQYGIFERPVKVYDINSAYPYAMLHQHPWGVGYDEWPGLPSSGIERALLTVEAPSVGAFPFRGDDQGLEFPHDGKDRLFKVTGWEYLAFRELWPKLKHKVTHAYTFRETVEFNAYIDHFYALKKSASKGSAEYLFAKLMMNSLYGKFGANPSEYRDYMLCPAEDYLEWEDSTRYALADFIGPFALLDAPLPDAAQHYYHVALASSITGFVRAYGLRAQVKTFGQQFYDHPDLFYMDTDGVQAGRAMKVPVGDDLGQWNVEFKATRAGFAGPKLYVLEDEAADKPAVEGLQKMEALKKFRASKRFKFASKGVGLTPPELWRVCAGESVSWQNDAPSWSLKTGTRFLERSVRMKRSARP